MYKYFTTFGNLNFYNNPNLLMVFKYDKKIKLLLKRSSSLGTKYYSMLDTRSVINLIISLKNIFYNENSTVLRLLKTK